MYIYIVILKDSKINTEILKKQSKNRVVYRELLIHVFEDLHVYLETF